MARKFVVETFGCQMNYHDSERITGLLEADGYTPGTDVADADLVIGAVLVPGGRAPTVVSDDMIMSMRPRSVLVDVAIDQGGCVETIKATTHENPVYTVDGIIHYGVANMPGGVPRTSTLALTNATFPYALKLANKGWKAALADDAGLLKGLNVVAGKVTYQGVAEAFGLKYHAPEKFL